MPSTEASWPHAPEHRLGARGIYFVTCGTYLKVHHFRGADRLKILHDSLLNTAQKYGWDLEAWAVFANHLHFVGRSPTATNDAQTLATFMSEFHTATATVANRMDNTTGRTVWHNFWETILTFEKSYFARLNYVHQNPVKHGLVTVANQYPWCSAPWFENNAKPGAVKSIYAFKIDRIQAADDYLPAPEW